MATTDDNLIIIVVFVVLITISCFWIFCLSRRNSSFSSFFERIRKNNLIYQEENFKIKNDEIEEGRAHFLNEKVIVCGLVRNIEKNFDSLVKLLVGISSLFSEYQFIFVENDSTDCSRKLLFDLKENAICKYGLKTPGIIHILKMAEDVNNDDDDDDTNSKSGKLVIDDKSPWNLSLPVESGRERSRIEKMVFLRNVYMKYINDGGFDQNNENGFPYKYTIIIDCDNVTNHQNHKGVGGNSISFVDRLASCGYYFNREEKIHAIGANTVGIKDYKYYDGYSLNFFPDAIKMFTKGFYYCSANALKGDVTSSLIKVKSCFGGLVIYKTKHIYGKKYKTFMRTDLFSSYLNSFKRLSFPICEHKPFNYLVDNVYINPRLLVFI